MFEAVFGTVLFVIFIFMWIGFERVTRWGLLTDLAVHATLIWMFKGTYAGMMTGVISAAVISIILQCLRRYYKLVRPPVAKRSFLQRMGIAR